MRRLFRSSASGFSIAEMMVVASVAFVILVLLTDVFLTVFKRTQDSRLRVDLQQHAIFAVSRWERDLERTAARAMVVKPGDPMCVAMTQAGAISGNGLVSWQEEIICWAFQKGERVVIRDTYPPKAPVFGGEPSVGTPYLPTFTELDGLIEETSGAEKIMCRDVEEFSLTNSKGATSALDDQPLILTLKLRKPLSEPERFAEFAIERRYTLRNTF